jgi:hypothetical protein
MRGTGEEKKKGRVDEGMKGGMGGSIRMRQSFLNMR